MNVLLAFVLGTTFNAQVVAGQPTYDFKEGGVARSTIEAGGLICPGSSAAASLPGTCKNGSVVQDSTNGQLRVCQANVWRPLVMPLACSAGQALTSTSTTAYACTSSLTANAYSGTLPVSNGGTNSTATPTGGGVGYGTGTAHAYTSAGTSGQKLQSAGGSAPTWADSPNFSKTISNLYNSSTSSPTTLLSWSIPAYGAQGVMCSISAFGTASAAPRFAVTVPSGASHYGHWMKFPTSAATAVFELVSAGSYTAASGTGLSSGAVWVLHGTIGGGANAGTVALVMLSSTSGQQVAAATGSHCIWY